MKIKLGETMIWFVTYFRRENELMEIAEQLAEQKPCSHKHILRTD